MSAVDEAVAAAVAAFPAYRDRPAEDRALFLEAIAEEIEALGPALIDTTMAETALPRARLEGERARTTGQLRLFAKVVREGWWQGARIDHGDPGRQPLPKPDLRTMLVPLGPVAVFGASNFPFAYSTAGGDTASALAAGCPVVLKAHPAHPKTSALVAGAIREAGKDCAIPAGAFGHVTGGVEEGLALVRHPGIRAVGFTGSLKAGRALFDAAAARPDPIPVYAEMGSVNPVVVLPSALERDATGLAAGLVASFTLGVGQFCTNPGLVLTVDSPAARSFVAAVGAGAAKVAPAPMLNAGIRTAFAAGADRMGAAAGVTTAGRSAAPADAARNESGAVVFSVTGADFLANPRLHEEVFGPSTLVVLCRDLDELDRAVGSLPGQLTGTVHGSEAELAERSGLVARLRDRVGRLVYGGFPTGVEVGHAIEHGGPYPATTDARTTSVGSAAIVRFARPVCWQNCPPALLPAALRDDNPLGLLRLVDGTWTADPC